MPPTCSPKLQHPITVRRLQSTRAGVGGRLSLFKPIAGHTTCGIPATAFADLTTCEQASNRSVGLAGHWSIFCIKRPETSDFPRFAVSLRARPPRNRGSGQQEGPALRAACILASQQLRAVKRLRTSGKRIWIFNLDMLPCLVIPSALLCLLFTGVAHHSSQALGVIALLVVVVADSFI